MKVAQDTHMEALVHGAVSTIAKRAVVVSVVNNFTQLLLWLVNLLLPCPSVYGEV